MVTETKYIFVTGGVLSSLGKGIAAASLGMLLEHRGIKIAIVKFDPYLNVDPGTMNPYQHGEVYVTEDGAETDLDLGHYHRFTNSPLTKKSSVSSGQIYNDVIKRERHGDYLGKTVQIIPHITDEIKQRILAVAAQEPGIQIVLVEIGGTVGDIESLPYLEAIRQFRNEHPQDCLNIHLTYVPYVKSAGEVKTKPTQHSVQNLRSIGIIPDIILARCEMLLQDDVKEKIALFCNVDRNMVFDAVDADTIYQIPLNFHRQGVEEAILRKLNCPIKPCDLTAWSALIESIRNPKETVRIGFVGKYVQHQDAYKSIFESLQHAAIHCNVRIEIVKHIPDDFDDEKELPEEAQGCDGYLLPGGFGNRGWEGALLTAKYCREHKVPYFGICLGMQIMCCEFGRNVVNLPRANSTEMDPETPHPVISLLEEQHKISDRGGTMRLGTYPCALKKGTHAHKAYGKDVVGERHRHRYEFNNTYRERYEEKGMLFSGIYEANNLVEICEIKGHPWMLGVQCHPEFRSKPTLPHPLFKAFIEAALQKKHSHAKK